MKLFKFTLKAITDDENWKKKMKELPDDILELLHKKDIYLVDGNIEVLGNKKDEKKFS